MRIDNMNNIFFVESRRGVGHWGSVGKRRRAGSMYRVARIMLGDCIACIESALFKSFLDFAVIPGWSEAIPGKIMVCCD
jgi:hypothetical protein